MKKLLSVSIATLALAAVADYSPITVGVTAISTTSKNTIVAVPYSAIGTTDPIAPKDLVKAANLPEGTMLYVFNGTLYYAWRQAGNGAWEVPDTVSTDTNKVSGVSVTTTAESVTLNKGSALWVVLPKADTYSATIYVYGEGSSPATTSTVSAGNSLVANPLQSPASFTVSGAMVGDIITIPNDSGDPTLYRYNGTTWRTFGPGVSPADATLSIGAGHGFWYSAIGSSVTINWTAEI